ncbi:proline--tRNA ligase [Candidatus Cerribacteria bacterium 'Amazon FNV 2010 28 9']|uniref:Proline--tRNA ligase n=1 Tax=Candidatus Cerribacteria bacterium 'Amazon FNV 2010 28 9' TaxID=2081795 RepID=A0A317JS55_9BACT|nr:MAG: proline--tRNA ligase [Candidatus Cerribacteria bacterium 'Amazon FNV 2010 28 9']
MKGSMKYSKLYGKTSKGELGGSQFTSHQLLTRGGFIQESTAGRYYFLPLGWRVHQKIREIIKQEMDAIGAQEMITPTLHPLELWEETNRTNSVGFELMKIQDGRGSWFALGGTAEEMFVDSVRTLHLSYKDLPFNIYQFSNKFRDEKRARGGLLRVREFIMKDAYSFDRDETAFVDTYAQMADVYTRIFKRLGLNTLKVEADGGYIGGDYCHEYQVESPIGEGRFFVSEDGLYVAHEDVAKFKLAPMNADETVEKLKEVDAVRGNTMEDGVAFHHLPLWKQMKDFMVVNERNELILAVIRGDLDVNETKLKKVTGSYQLRHATEEEIRSIGSEPGFISPVGLHGKVKIVGDTSLRTVINFYGGANAKHRDALNINIDRDFSCDIEADIAMCQDGCIAENGSVLHEKRGIEVGNIFQLGYHYTSKMKGATFVDVDGKEKPYYMGCYGIGLGRTMAAIVEKYADARGIMWPKTVAPFAVHLIDIQSSERGQEVHNMLQKEGIEVLWDDRDERAGAKFADADLIGIPVRLVVSVKTGEKIEYKERTSGEAQLLTVEEVVRKLKE